MHVKPAVIQNQSEYVKKTPQVVIKLDSLQKKLPVEYQQKVTPKYQLNSEKADLNNEADSGSDHICNVSNQDFKSWVCANSNTNTEKVHRMQSTPFSSAANSEKHSSKLNQGLNDSCISSYQNVGNTSILLRIQEEILNSEARSSTRGRYITRKQAMSKFRIQPSIDTSSVSTEYDIEQYKQKLEQSKQMVQKLRQKDICNKN